MPYSNKDSDILTGVQCSVVNCTYHSKEDTCHAKQIKVDNRTASTTTETSCTTFKNKG